MMVTRRAVPEETGPGGLYGETEKRVRGERSGDHWHLDRKVPISIIVALVVQTGGVLVWATKLDGRVERLEQAETQQRERDVRQDIATHELIDGFNRRIDQLDAKLDRIIERHVKQ